MTSGEKVLRVEIDNEDAGIDLIINPTSSPYSGGSFASYDVPQIKDRNPIFTALKGKASQLRGATGITGVIVGDGDCTALSDRPHYRNEVSATAIAEDFFRQHSSMDFVLFLKVREKRHPMPCAGAAKRWIEQQLIVRDGCQVKSVAERFLRRKVLVFAHPSVHARAYPAWALSFRSSSASAVKTSSRSGAVPMNISPMAS